MKCHSVFVFLNQLQSTPSSHQPDWQEILSWLWNRSPPSPPLSCTQALKIWQHPDHSSNALLACGSYSLFKECTGMPLTLVASLSGFAWRSLLGWGSSFLTHSYGKFCQSPTHSPSPSVQPGDRTCVPLTHAILKSPQLLLEPREALSEFFPSLWLHHPPNA